MFENGTPLNGDVPFFVRITYHGYMLSRFDPREVATPERLEKLRRAIAYRQADFSVVLENVHDEHNVAAVLRSCDAVGMKDIYLVYNGKTVFPSFGRKVSGSAKKWVDKQYFENTADCFAALRARGMCIYTTRLSSDARSIYDLDFTKPTAIVFGNEHSGVSDEAVSAADGNVLIPQVGMVESLNISVAAAVTVFEAARQRRAAGLYAVSQLSEEQREELLIDWLQR